MSTHLQKTFNCKSSNCCGRVVEPNRVYSDVPTAKAVVQFECPMCQRTYFKNFTTVFTLAADGKNYDKIGLDK